jgi:hemoglobin
MSDLENQTQSTLFDEIGGYSKIKELVDQFYDLMELDSQFAELRKVHPIQLDSSREKLTMFLSGWTGGPNLYIEKYGHPKLRARHLPYPINLEMRDQWLRCMGQAMINVQMPELLWEKLLKAFFDTADWMRNQAN